MNFEKLSLYFQKLENTASRNLMVGILADLFKHTTGDEISQICYLLQGRVVPLYDSLEFGMADKMVIKAIASASSTSPEKVNDKFKELGDLGKAVEKLKAQSAGGRTKLSVTQVFDVLKKMAQAKGAGSVEKKITLLADLLKEADSLSSRYLVRIPLDKLRLGFSDMTILDGLSWMLSSSKVHRKEIEKAYNVRPDLGFIAKTIKDKGLSGLVSVTPVVGTPILMAKADRLTSPKEILEKIGKCAIEFKYDGLRLQVHYKKIKNKEEIIKLFSRNLEDVTLMFPDIVAAVKKQVTVDEVIFEGEVVAFNPKTGVFIPFQQTMQRKRKYNIAQKALEIPVKLFAFELLYAKGQNFIHKPYIERKAKLKEVIGKGELIIYAKEFITDSEQRIDELFHESIAQGFEGIIAKKLTGVYQAGMRGWNWIKFKKAMSKKLMDTFDVLVMGYTKGEGKRTDFGMGQFITGVYDNKKDQFTTITKIGTGLTDEQFREFIKRVKPLETPEKPKNYEIDKLLEPDVWLKPSLVVEVAADEITRSQVHTSGRIMELSKSGKAQQVKEAGYALRFPRLVSFRDDKNPQEVTTVTEVEEMFTSQKK
ncbi:MAG: ATP-dependent DNA ligase [Patescibacteria group bacterium]|nr:ATP-dependent DNA ligase [Patescibacteria group bacterium]